MCTQALESGDEYPKTVGLSADYKKLNRFANITNCESMCMPQHVNNAKFVRFMTTICHICELIVLHGSLLCPPQMITIVYC